MGTFHDNLGALHGITVLVETTAQQAVVGRCHEANEEHVLLMDAAVHEDGDPAVTRSQWIERAVKWGVFPNHKVLKLDAKNVTKITPLNQL